MVARWLVEKMKVESLSGARGYGSGVTSPPAIVDRPW